MVETYLPIKDRNNMVVGAFEEGYKFMIIIDSVAKSIKENRWVYINWDES